MKRIVIPAIVLMLAAPGAHAHALLDHAEPAVGNTVAAPPHEVRLWFTQKLEAAFSTVTVSNDAGQRIDAGKPRVDGEQISVPLHAAAKGVYHVKWRVLSVDSHSTQGSFSFTVGP